MQNNVSRAIIIITKDNGSNLPTLRHWAGEISIRKCFRIMDLALIKDLNYTSNIAVSSGSL